MLPRVDYLTVHTPLTPETKNLIDAPQNREDEAGRAADQLLPAAGSTTKQALADALTSGTHRRRRLGRIRGRAL